MHAVYYLKNPGEEFRYSLRSAAKYGNVTEVTVIGDVPSWLKGAKVLSGNPTQDANINSVANAHIAARAFKDEFLLCNDDFFWLRDAPETYPRWYFLTMTQHLGFYTDPRSAHWRKLYMDTAKYLTYRKIMMPKSYELHIPMPVIGGELDRVLNLSAASRELQGPGLWRSLYGNLAPSLRDIQAVQRDDVKVGNVSTFENLVDFASTDERTLRGILPILRDRFPDRSPWERK